MNIVRALGDRGSRYISESIIKNWKCNWKSKQKRFLVKLLRQKALAAGRSSPTGRINLLFGCQIAIWSTFNTTRCLGEEALGQPTNWMLVLSTFDRSAFCSLSKHLYLRLMFIQLLVVLIFVVFKVFVINICYIARECNDLEVLQ